MKQLGEILLEEGLVTEDELLRALDEQIARGTSLGRVLVELGVLTENQLVAALAQQVGMRFVDLDDYAVDRAAVVKVPGPVCQRYNVLPIAIDNGQLILAMADPGNVLAIDDVRQVAQMPVQPVVSTHENLARALQRYIRADGEMDDLAHALSGRARRRN